MAFRRWYLGAGAALAAFLPLAANAGPEPNLTGGFGGQVEIKFTGNTAEDSLAGIAGGPTFGASCVGAGGTAPCSETTFGAGVVTSVTEHNNPAIQTWTSGTNNQFVAFFLYGIADQGNTAGSPITLYNTGANNGNVTTGGSTTFKSGGKFDGVIHLDLYYGAIGSAPCFVGSGCVKPTDRTDIDQLPGVTDQTLFARFILVPGIVANGTNGTTCATGDNNTPAGCITLQQTVNALSDPADGGGAFYLDCVAGPGCSQFGADGFLVNSYISDFFGKFTVSSLNPADNNGWQESITDPILANPVPEPASLAALGSGLALFGVAMRRRRQKAGSS